MEISTTGCTVTYSTCKYRMPCGYCELKKEQCNMLNVPVQTPWVQTPWVETPLWRPLDPDPNRKWEITCKNETN